MLFLHYISRTELNCSAVALVAKISSTRTPWWLRILNSRHVLYVRLGPVYVCSSSSSSSSSSTSAGLQQSAYCQPAGYETHQSRSQIVQQMWGWLASSSFDVTLEFLDSMSAYLRLADYGGRRGLDLICGSQRKQAGRVEPSQPDFQRWGVWAAGGRWGPGSP